MNPLKPNARRAKNAMLLLWIMLVLDVIALISAYFQYNLLKAVAAGEMVTEEAANSNDAREQLIAVVTIITFIISAITFIQWFRRAYYNLHQKISVLSEPEGWAAGAWFVPFVNLWKPYQIMKELYQETRELLLKNGITGGENLTTNWLWVWWTLWITNKILGQIVFRTSMVAKTVDGMIDVTVLGMTSNVIGVFLELAALKVIYDYSKAELFLNDARGDKEVPASTVIPA